MHEIINQKKEPVSDNTFWLCSVYFLHTMRISYITTNKKKAIVVGPYDFCNVVNVDRIMESIKMEFTV